MPQDVEIKKEPYVLFECRLAEGLYVIKPTRTMIVEGKPHKIPGKSIRPTRHWVYTNDPEVVEYCRTQGEFIEHEDPDPMVKSVALKILGITEEGKKIIPKRKKGKFGK